MVSRVKLLFHVSDWLFKIDSPLIVLYLVENHVQDVEERRKKDNTVQSGDNSRILTNLSGTIISCESRPNGKT